MIWRSKDPPLHRYCPFCDGNMTMVQEYSTFTSTKFNDDKNEYYRPYAGSNDFLNHIKEFSVNLNGQMKCSYHHWLYIILNALEI